MREKKLFIFATTIIIIFTFMIAACQSCNINFPPVKIIPESGENENADETDETAVDLKKDTVEEEEEITAVNIWIEDIVPSDISVRIRNRLMGAFNEIRIVERKEDSDIQVEINTGKEKSIATWFLVPAVSFFRAFDSIYYDDFKNFWEGDTQSLEYISTDGSGPGLILTEDIYKALEKIMGQSGNEKIKIVSREELASSIEDNSSFSIIPFDSIEKKYKVLNMDNASVFDRNLDKDNYPLGIGISVKSDNPEIEGVINGCLEGIYITNRDIEKMTSVVMTGVTALARGKTIGRKMDEIGVLYPAEKIADVLLDADITHISNEICFVEGCSSENRFPYLCSSPEYIELLRYVGTDVIELTGNHMNDYGPEWMLKTLKMYDEEGWLYFGGGRNLEESYRPALFEVNSNKIAFMGVNAYGLANINEWAREDSPGAARLNVWDEAGKEKDFEKVEDIIRELKSQGYTVIFTFQYQESERYSPTEKQIADFRRIIDAGADIVSGSQSHWPMGVEFRENGFINYGLGNLFYNMRDIKGLKQGIIAKHIFYEGRHINTIMITTMLEDLSQPRLTTAEEREELLNLVFGGSIR